MTDGQVIQCYLPAQGQMVLEVLQLLLPLIDKRCLT